MMLLQYLIFISSAIFAIGIAGLVSSRHFLVMMLSIEISLTASTLLAMSFFYYAQSSNIIMLLLAIWAVASTEILAMVVFYRYMVKNEISLDVSKLSKLKN
jgi:NADH-quinone oxidoreductase subunit K